MAVAHQASATSLGDLVGMPLEQSRHLGLDRLRQKRSCAIAEDLGQRIGKSLWLKH